MLGKFSESRALKTCALEPMACEDLSVSMRFFHFESLPSTQTYAVRKLKCFYKSKEASLDSKHLSTDTQFSFIPPFCIRAIRQSEGIGSRGNSWESVSNALLFSFVLPLHALPKDLKIESSSIFFGVIMQQFLHSKGSRVWLKYPNDLYVEDKKVGGILTQKIRDFLVCGIGLNLFAYFKQSIQNEESKAQIKPKRHTLEPSVSLNVCDDKECEGFLKEFFKTFEKFGSWKQIFSIYQLEFCKNNAYFFHHGERRICLKDTKLNDDGSLSFEGQRLYSLR